MKNEDAFLGAILDQPDDDTSRLVYADWLEERGDLRGEFLRLDCALARLPAEDPRYVAIEARIEALACVLDSTWLARVGERNKERYDVVLVGYLRHARNLVMDNLCRIR